jgi:isoleucyl-tRNA synthetase
MEEKNDQPIILYVEGQDQFRGWFNSSLITSVILTGKAPYQQVLSHGFVVDEKGHKMSKSLGNIIDPEDLIKKFGTDVLRLWVVSSDFTKEVKVSILILENIRESYQKIRNTLRFLLGNLANLPPELKSEKDLEQELSPVDYYILHKLEKLLAESQKNYSEYNFNPIYSSLLNFCINDLSSFYFEISKDSLYCDSLNSTRRKQIITTLYYLLAELLKIIAPILPFLAEEIYQNIPFRFGFANQESIHLVNYSDLKFSLSSEKNFLVIANFFLTLRQDIYQTLEKARQKQIIATNSQAHVTIYLLKKEKWDYSGLNLEKLLLVSKVKIIVIQELKESGTPAQTTYLSPNVYQEYNLWNIRITKTDKEKCLRCWNYRDLTKSGLCSRCQEVFLRIN